MAPAVYVGSAVWFSPAVVVLAVVPGPRFCGVTAVAVPAAVCRCRYHGIVLSAGVASEPKATKKIDGSTAVVAVSPRIESSGAAIGAMLPDSVFRSMLIEGVWGGVGSVVIFLPQILLLFLFIGILEDSGYLARAALIADRTMAKVGLQGKSFIPLLSAYACAVPAIMSTRTIESKRDRIATILIAPFMTCSARLPVYMLIIAAFIPERSLLGPIGTQLAALLGLYFLGFAAAIVTARLLKSSILKGDRTPFLMELPPYRWPTVRSLGTRLLDRAKVFLVRAGTVIPKFWFFRF